MVRYPNFSFWQIASIYPVLACFLALPASPGIAQIIPDSTLLNNSTVIPGCLNCVINGGTKQGNILFHSFEQFSIQQNGAARFNNDPLLGAIITRVTGLQPSNIDGLITANGNTDLFLLNPRGITFGSNAQLQLGGSFLATTASSFLFPNGGQFSAIAPTSPPLLAVDVKAPIGLIFEDRPGSIQLQSTRLSTNPATTLALVGGDIDIANSSLTARLGSRLELGSVRNAGTIPLVINSNEIRFQFPDNVIRGDIAIRDNTSIRSVIKVVNELLDEKEDAGVQFAGHIQVAGHNITVSNHSEIVAENGLFLAPYQLLPSGISFNATGYLQLNNGSSIMNLSGGKTEIQAGKLSLNNKSAIANKIEAQPKYDFINKVIGTGGIDVKIDEEINIEDSSISIKSQISKYKFNNEIFIPGPLPPIAPIPPSIGVPGDNGFIIADSNISEIRQNPNQIRTGATYNPIYGSIDVSARSGNLNISVKSLSLNNGAQIKFDSSTELNEVAHVGDIIVDVQRGINIVGSNSTISSRVANSNDVSIGNIKLRSGSLSLKDGAQIATTVEGYAGARNVGNIELELKHLLLMQNNSKIAVNAQKVSVGNFLPPGNIIIEDKIYKKINGKWVLSEDFPTLGAGNIRINISGGFIVAKGNSDIQANAYFGSGGQINITAKKDFGIVKRDREELSRLLGSTSPDDLDSSRLKTNDIVAISQTNPRLNGQVGIDTLNTDPGSRFNQLPQEPRTTGVADNCQVSNGKESVQFFDIGRGGLPPRPEDPLSIDLLEWASNPPSQSLSPDKIGQTPPNRPYLTSQDSIDTPKLLPPCQSH